MKAILSCKVGGTITALRCTGKSFVFERPSIASRGLQKKQVILHKHISPEYKPRSRSLKPYREMDPASCRVIYIDDRFPIEKWLTRDSATSTTTTNDRVNQALWMDLVELPPDLQANVNALVYVFNQGRIPLFATYSRYVL